MVACSRTLRKATSLIAVAMIANCWMSYAEAEEQLICLGEKSAGVRWTGSSWEVAKFDVISDKFLVQPVKAYTFGGSRVTFEVRRFGSKVLEYRCFDRNSYGEIIDTITCGNVFAGMIVHKKHLRFQVNYSGGFVNGIDTDGNTPSITIGTCQSAGKVDVQREPFEMFDK